MSRFIFLKFLYVSFFMRHPSQIQLGCCPWPCHPPCLSCPCLPSPQGVGGGSGLSCSPRNHMFWGGYGPDPGETFFDLYVGLKRSWGKLMCSYFAAGPKYKVPTNGPYSWSPGLMFGAPCASFRATPRPMAPRARRGTPRAENRSKPGAGVFNVYSLRSAQSKYNSDVP